MTERQELHCHACNQYVQFDIDLSLNGNHVLECPNCGHEHFRVVKDGVITESRWKSSGPTFSIQGATTSATSAYASAYGYGGTQQTTSATGGSVYLSMAWGSTSGYARGWS